jgi:hypothetical protein
MKESFPLAKVWRNSVTKLTCVRDITDNMGQPIPSSQEIISALEDKFPEIVI